VSNAQAPNRSNTHMSFFAARGAAGSLARSYQQSRSEAKRKALLEQLADEQAELDARRASDFETFDEDSSGTISRAEFKKALTTIKREVTGCPNAEVSEADVKLAWGARLRWETLDGQSLLRLINGYKRQLAEEKASTQERFSRFDADGSGGLSLDEFRALLHESVTGASYSEQEVRKIMGRADVDGSGEVTLSELHAALATWGLQLSPASRPGAAKPRRAW